MKAILINFENNTFIIVLLTLMIWINSIELIENQAILKLIDPNSKAVFIQETLLIGKFC